MLYESENITNLTSWAYYYEQFPEYRTMSGLFLYAEIIIPAFLTLAAVVAYLFREMRIASRRAYKAHVESFKHIADLNKKIGELKGSQDGVMRMSREVIAEIRTIRDMPVYNRRRYDRDFKGDKDNYDENYQGDRRRDSDS